MEPASVISQPFFEIERAHAAFAVFELDSAQIGSGRPGGPRSALWGSIVVVARASLEEALRRIHGHLCAEDDCEYTKVPLDRANFSKFFSEHGVTPADSIPTDLHVAQRSKPNAKSGDGTGVLINGPLTSSGILDQLDALNHIRNGFAHRDPRKTESLPPHGAGVLWVAPESGNEWTVQKPHAFSAMRFCHSVFRYAVLSCWGAERAIACRSSLPLLLEDRLARESHESPVVLHEALGQSLEKEDLKKSLALARSIQVALLSHHTRDATVNQGKLPLETSLDERVLNLYDPVLPAAYDSRQPIETPPSSPTLLDSGMPVSGHDG